MKRILLLLAPALSLHPMSLVVHEHPSLVMSDADHTLWTLQSLPVPGSLECFYNGTSQDLVKNDYTVLGQFLSSKFWAADAAPDIWCNYWTQ